MLKLALNTLETGLDIMSILNSFLLSFFPLNSAFAVCFNIHMFRLLLTQPQSLKRKPPFPVFVKAENPMLMHGTRT